MPEKVLKKDLINDVLRVKKEIGKMGRKDYLKYGKYSRAPIERLFGSWNNMLRELDLEINMNKNVTKEEIFQDMLRLKKEYGKVTSTIQRKHGKYSQVCIDNLFGSFTSMLRELGLDTNHAARGLTDEEVLDKLREIYDDHGYLTSTLITKHGDFCYQTLINRFGSMSKVYELMGVKNNPNSNYYFSSVEYVVGIIADYLGEDPLLEYTDDDFVNPHTGWKLFVDAYFPKHNIMVEYDGQQHFEYVPFLHGNDTNKFKEQQERDAIKNFVAVSKGIAILHIKYDEPKTVEHIRYRIEKILKSR